MRDADTKETNTIQGIFYLLSYVPTPFRDHLPDKRIFFTMGRRTAAAAKYFHTAHRKIISYRKVGPEKRWAVKGGPTLRTAISAKFRA